MMRLEMLQRSMNSELRAVMENYVLEQRGRLEETEVDSFMD